MTMHLARGLTTINTKKRKKAKLTLSKISKYQEQMKIHNKEMKRLVVQSVMNLQEYIDYCLQGNYKPKSTPTVTKAPWQQEGYTHHRSKPIIANIVHSS